MNHVYFNDDVIVPTQLVQEIMDNCTNLTVFYVGCSELFDLKKYTDEWKAGARTIDRWYITFPVFETTDHYQLIDSDVTRELCLTYWCHPCENLVVFRIRKRYRY